MINVGVILAAFGWQAIGAGMLAKNGYDNYKRNKTARQEYNYYAPVTNWWNRYGVSEDECSRFLTSYERSLYAYDSEDLKNDILRRLRSCIQTDDYYVKSLLTRGGNSLVDHMRVCILYYASMGRAAIYGSHMDRRFPMAGALDTKPGLKKVVLQLLEENGVKDTHWYCSRREEQERYLRSMNR